MATATWTIDLDTGPRQVVATFGYWFLRAKVVVDGRTVVDERPYRRMGRDRGVDLPFSVDGHALVVMVRPVIRGPMIVFGYRLGLSVDRSEVPGMEPMDIRRRPRLGQQLQIISWFFAAGVFLEFFLAGSFGQAIAYLVAPATCTLLVRRSGLTGPVLAIACAAILGVGLLLAVASVGPTS